MKRNNIMVLMISLSLILLLGSSYALLRSKEVGSNPYVINVGNLQVTFDSGKTEKLSLENMYPISDKEGMSQSDELGFTVKNTGTVASYYDITLEETSTNPEFKSVIRFISNKDSQGYNDPKTLSKYKYVDVGGYLEPNASSSYKVKVWLDYNADNTYMNKEFKAKVVVNSFQESSYAKDVIKGQLVKYSESSKEDFGGGLVAVNTDGELYNETIETQEIREYRYSGPYVNNYVTFNDEEWRIVGVFKDENGEHLKLVKNNILNNTQQWDTTSPYSNNWEDSEINNYLNVKYLNSLKEDSEDMIEETKYYLGTVTYEYIENSIDSEYLIIDTPQESYKYERSVEGCENGKGPATNSDGNAIKANESCRVWKGNSSAWVGKIAFLYPSDYGFSANIKNWKMKLSNFDTIKAESWLNFANKQNTWEWLLSSTTNNLNRVAAWVQNGKIADDGVEYWIGVRPCLYLKSNVKITSGNGTSETPYQLEI